MGIAASNIKPHIGAVVNVTRDALLDDAVIAQIMDLLEKRGVLVFPRIGLNDAEQLAFTDKLGKRVTFTGGVPGMDSDLYKVSLDPKHNPQPEYVQSTFFWHMDGLTVEGSPPPRASLLSGRRIAAKGGQTDFANTYIAYERLPESEKADLQGLRVVHNLMKSMKDVVEAPTEEDLARWQRMPAQEHPLVWTHRSGRKSLVLGTTADQIVGMPRPDGRSLLARMLEWTSQPDFCYRHEWQVGDLVIWDNCGTLHRAIPYDRNSGRLMHRTTIEGSEPVM